MPNQVHQKYSTEIVQGYFSHSGIVPRPAETQDGEFLRFYRSWTGVCIYKGRVVRKDSVPRIDKLIANRDPEQYSETNDEKDRLMFEMLIAEELGKDSGAIWDAIFSLDK